MRIREQGNIDVVSVDTYTTTTTCGGGVSTTHNYLTSLRNGSTKKTVDVVNPGFHRLVARGAVFCNNFSSEEITEASSCSGTDSQTFVPACSGSTVRSVVYGPFAVDAHNVALRLSEHASALTSARALSATAALAGVAEPDVSGLVELAELNKTLRMVPDYVRSTTRLLRRLRRTKRYRKGRYKCLGEYVAGTYLMERYGITPLKHTMDGIVDALTRVGGLSPRFTSRSSTSTGVFDTNISGMVDGSIRIMTNKASSIESIVRSGVLYEHTLSFDSFGMRPSEIPSAIWELIPYSFVADWFLNVGDFIRAVTPKAGVRVLASWQTVLTTESRTNGYYTVANSSDPNWSVVCNRQGSHNVVRVLKTRSCGLSAELATKFHEIRFEKQRDFLHAADALALLSQVLLSK